MHPVFEGAIATGGFAAVMPGPNTQTGMPPGFFPDPDRAQLGTGSQSQPTQCKENTEQDEDADSLNAESDSDTGSSRRGRKRSAASAIGASTPTVAQRLQQSIRRDSPGQQIASAIKQWADTQSALVRPIPPAVPTQTKSEAAISRLSDEFNHLPDEDLAVAFDVVYDERKAALFLAMPSTCAREKWLERQIQLLKWNH